MDKNEIMMTTEPQEENSVRVYVDNNPQPAMPMKWFTFYKNRKQSKVCKIYS